MAIAYNVVTIDDFDDDAATIALLDAQGVNDWDLIEVLLSPDEETGKSTALCIFKK